MKSSIKFVGIFVICLAIVVAAIIIFNPKSNPVVNSGDVKYFSSVSELKDFVKQTNQNNYYGKGMFSEAMPAAAEAIKTTDSAGGSQSYSTTNVQIEGVDEPDFIKNDGKYIYLASGNSISIIDAYPAENMKNVSKIDIGKTVDKIFVNGDRLIVFSSDYSYIGYSQAVSSLRPCYGGSCGGSSNTFTNVFVYNIADRKNPELEQNISVEGSYNDARMIGNFVYLISTQYVDNSNPMPPIYKLNGAEKQISIGDIGYFNYQDSSYVFSIISAINLDNQDFKTKVFLTGASSTIFVSQNNIYLTHTKYVSQEEILTAVIKDSIVPILPDKIGRQISSIIDENGNDRYNQIQEIIQNYSNSLSGKDKEDFDALLFNKTEEGMIKLNRESLKTVIHKLSIDGENINYVAAGEVSGSVLDQYSMDEYKGNLRIATTLGNGWEGNSENNLYVLNSDLKLQGKVEGMAEGERIYAVRFLEDRAYIVTFKNVDPLFVIGLADAKNPEVLGFLKIPGYSDYIHIYDKNHIIGIGKEVNESIDADKVHSPGAVYYTAILGVKVSLFDVSDVAKPSEVAKLVIGDRGTDSPALYDSKAVLFDKEKNLLVLPISLVENQDSQNQVTSEYAYVLNISPDGITVRGKITHVNNAVPIYGPAKEEPIGATRNDSYGNIWIKVAVDNFGNVGDGLWKTNASGYETTAWGDMLIDQQPGGINYYNYADNYNFKIQRSLFIGNTLYTVSSAAIKANDLTSLDEISRLDIPSSNNYPIFYGMKGGVALA